VKLIFKISIHHGYHKTLIEYHCFLPQLLTDQVKILGIMTYNFPNDVIRLLFMKMIE